MIKTCLIYLHDIYLVSQFLATGDVRGGLTCAAMQHGQACWGSGGSSAGTWAAEQKRWQRWQVR